MKTYRLTAAGRRLTLTLMAGAVLLWIFAVWMLPTTLGISYRDLSTTLGAAVQRGFGAAQLIPAGILIVMLVAAPLLLWSLWEEWSTSYTVGDDGLTYRTRAGIELHYPWTAIHEVRAGESEDSVVEVIVQPGVVRQIRNPLLRWLHRQAFGAHRVPIYADVEARDELLAEITRRSGLAPDAGPDATSEVVADSTQA